MSRFVPLRSSAEFRRVYANGGRYEAAGITVFIQPNSLAHHRFGITASSRAVGNAVCRNRAKRLLRETIRLSSSELDTIPRKYDWVINAKRSLLKSGLARSFQDFQTVTARISSLESN